MELTYDSSIHGIAARFSLRKLLYYSTLASIFSEALMIDVGTFRLQLSYVLLLFNLLLMLLLGQFSLHRKLVTVCLYLGASAAIGIANGTDTVGLAAKQFAGISISAFYFYNFFQLQENRFERAFRDYAIACYWCSVVGLFMVPIQGAIRGADYIGNYRLHSVLPEPAHFATVCAAGLYYFADQWVRHRRYGRQLAVTLLAFVCSGSSVGYLGVALGLFLLFSRYRYSVLIAPVLIGTLLFGIFFGSEWFRERVVDTTVAVQESSVEGANLSTFALVANMFVTERVFEDSPLLGHGLGSHSISHEHFLEEIPGVREFLEYEQAHMNAEDAASLFLRVVSELGLVGLFGVIAFIWYFRVPGQGPHAQISFAIMIYFSLKLLRHGHYFSPEQLFLVMIYILNYQSTKAAERAFKPAG